MISTYSSQYIPFSSFNSSNSNAFLNFQTSFHQIYDELPYYKKNLTTQSLPYSETYIQQLNLLTNVPNGNCSIQDIWVYDLSLCPYNATILYGDDPSFDTHPIGPFTCLGLNDINASMFDIRYNKNNFLVNCDPSNAIYSYYYPLSKYTISAQLAFSQSINNYFYNYDSVSSIILSIINAPLLVQYNILSELQKGIASYIGTATPSTDICSSVKTAFSAYAKEKFNWACNSSYAFIYGCVTIILSFAFWLIKLKQHFTPKADYIPITIPNVREP